MKKGDLVYFPSGYNLHKVSYVHEGEPYTYCDLPGVVRKELQKDDGSERVMCYWCGTKEEQK